MVNDNEEKWIYFIQRKLDGKIIKITGYNKPIEELKSKAEEWNNSGKDTTWEIIDDGKTIEIVEYFMPFMDVETNDDLKKRISRLESVIEDVISDLECAL